MAPAKEKPPSLTIVRRLNAAPDKVWRALTQPEALRQWMVPGDGFGVRLAETDVRVGGRYRILMQTADGQEHDVGGVYREIVAGRKLAYTWLTCSAQPYETLVTIELRAVSGGTELTLTHGPFADADDRDKHQNGWTGCLAHLETYFN